MANMLHLLGTTAAMFRVTGDDPPPPPVLASSVPYSYINFSELIGAEDNPTLTYTSRGLYPTLIPRNAVPILSIDGPPGVARYFSNTTTTTATKMFSNEGLEDRMHPTNPFTYEAWFRNTLTEGSAIRYQVVAEAHSSSAYRWRLNYVALTDIPSVDYFVFEAYITEAGTLVSIESETFTRNTWQHVAVTRDEDGLVRLFRNGVMEGSLSIPSIAYPTTATNFYLRGGCNDSGHGGHLDMALFRMETSKCLYEENFTPPGDADFNFGDPSGDPFLDSTMMAFTFDGEAAPTNAFARTHFGKVLITTSTVSSNLRETTPSRATSRAVANTTSAFAVANFAAENANAALSHAGKSLTAEYWWRVAVTRGDRAIAGGMGRWVTTDAQRSWHFGINIASGVNYVTLNYSTTGADTITLTGSTPLGLDTWYHLAFTYDRATETIRVFVNGVLEIKETGVTDLFDSTALFFMTNIGSSNGYVNSFYDDVRVTYHNRYPSDGSFTPPQKIPAYRQSALAYDIDPSYETVYGSGDRRHVGMRFEGTLTFVNQPQERILNGDNSTNAATWFTNSQSDRYIDFFFDIPEQITEVTHYQSTAATHGVWQWQGSHDGVTFTDIGGTFTLGGLTGANAVTTLSGNTTKYPIYRMNQVSGTTSSSPYIREFEFKISQSPAEYSYLNSLGSGDRRASITVTHVGMNTTGGREANTVINGSPEAPSTQFYWSKDLTDAEVTFDFGSGNAKVIRTINLRRSRLAQPDDIGEFEAQGSNDGTSWTTLDTKSVVNTALNFTTIWSFESNTTAYRYYRLKQVSGTTTSSNYWNEILFKIK